MAARSKGTYVMIIPAILHEGQFCVKLSTGFSPQSPPAAAGFSALHGDELTRLEIQKARSPGGGIAAGPLQLQGVHVRNANGSV